VALFRYERSGEPGVKKQKQTGGTIMTRTGSFKLALLAATAITAFASGAQAQQYTRAIMFGDSLSDQGNIAAANGGSVPNYLPLQLQQFSNGPVWNTQLFGASTNFFTTTNPNTGNVNFAFGGSRTTGAQTPGPTTEQQIGTYLQRGGTFGANDIVTLWGGANNLFQAQTAASATGAATDIGNQVRTLAGAGARTILVFNLPSFDSLPGNIGTPTQAQAGQLSFLFNSTLASNIAAAAAASPGANVISIPVDQIFTAVIANAGSFGFSNVTQACVANPACIAANGAGYLFWDTVHPTQAGHAIISASVGEYLSAPSRAAMISNAFTGSAFGNRRSAMIDGFTQLSTIKTDPGQWRYFVYAAGETGQASGNFQSGILASSGASNGRSHDYTLGGLRFGGLRDAGNGWTFGFMGSALTGKIDGSARKFEANNTQLGLDFLARWRSQTGSFVNLNLGGSLDIFSNYEYKALGVLTNTGSPNAVSLSAGAEVGHDFRFNAVTVTPQARLAYLNATLEKFTEAGVIAPIAYDSRTLSAFATAGEVKVSYQISQPLSVYVLGGYEAYLGKSGTSVGGRLAGNTAQPFNWASDALRSPGVVGGLGLNYNMGTTTARATYRVSLGDQSTTRHSLNIGLDTKF
jgi:outer membrane lipase/esterase